MIPDSEQIVALHGFTQTGASWRVIEATLGRPLLAPDLPGHGSASHERPTDLHEAAALVAARVVPGLHNRRAWWIGYSLGGRVLLHLALDRPDLIAGLILVSTTAGLESMRERDQRIAADAALADELERDGLGPFLDRWVAQPLFASLTLSEEERQDRRRNTPAGLSTSLRSCGTGTQAPLWNLLNQLTVPTVVVTGRRDLKFSELGTRLAATIPQAVHRQIDNAGHACHLEHPQQFVEAIQRD